MGVLTPFQEPSLVLPAGWEPAITGLPTDFETVNDVAEHISMEMDVSALEYKTFHIVATEVVTVGAPGNLQCWVELSPYSDAVTEVFYAAIGGGGGAMPPVAPTIIGGVGVNGMVHSVLLAFNMFSPYARVVVHTPVIAAADYWTVQVYAYGKTF